MTPDSASDGLLARIARIQKELPSPFRRFETSPELLTDAGTERPCALLWINRESFMAALLFVRKAPGAMESGGRCALALGLGQFVLLEGSKARLCTLGDSGPVAGRPLFIGHCEGEEGDRRLLDELKQLAVMASRGTESLSPLYFSNLLHSALLDLTPPLICAYRATRGEGQLEGDADRKGTEKARLALLRLLALSSLNLLPDSVFPEKLERAMDFVLEELPAPLPLLLKSAADELPLPEACNVRLHHLFRRLCQLHWHEHPDRAAQSLKRLLEQGAFGGSPLRPTEEGPEASTHIHNLRQLDFGDCRIFETADDASLLALKGLCQLRRGTLNHHRKRYLPGVQEVPATKAVLASLMRLQSPDETERFRLNLQLRSLLPGRRFGLDARTPRFIYDLLLFCAKALPGARLRLEIPSESLSELFTPPLANLLVEDWGLQGILQEEDRLILELRKAERSRELLIGARGKPRQRLRDSTPEILAVQALTHLRLPEPLVGALRDGHLAIWPAGQAQGEDLEAAKRFLASSPGRAIWAALSDARPLPGERPLGTWLQTHACLLPHRRLLRAFAQRLSSGQSADVHEFDAALPAPLVELCRVAAQPPQPAPVRPRRSQELSAIASSVFSDGLPGFPQHYLYSHYRPALEAYRFSPPLKLTGEFFGRFNLQDAEGQDLEIRGGERARALLLASSAGVSELELPSDDAICADILQRFEADLLRLRTELLRQTHAKHADAAKAERLARSIWREQSLPSWQLLEQA